MTDPATRDSATPARKGSNPLTRLAGILVFACFALSSWGYYYRLDDLPPYLDYDSSMLGMFVNNLTFHGQYDFRFDHSPDPHRMHWAAEALPITVPMSWLQRLLGSGPESVDAILKAAGVVLGAAGSLCAVVAAKARGRVNAAESLFLFGFSAALPPLLLYLRTGVPHFLFSFCMFWAAVAVVVRFVDSMRARYVYGLGVVLALYALVPYVPLAALPLVGLLIAVRRGALARILRNRHLYVAAAGSVALFVALQFAVAVSHDNSYGEWRSKADQFLGVRAPLALSLQNLQLDRIPGKLVKLVHQHFYFQRDALGDRSRSDSLWTLRQPHLVWLGLLPIALLGVWTAWRQRDPASDVFASVLLGSYALAFSFGTTEGRYLITVVPCYAWFVLVGARRLVPGQAWRSVALAATMLVTSMGSYAMVRGDYRASMIERWHAMGGMREVLALIGAKYPGYGRDKVTFLCWPDLDFEAWHYLEMLGNLMITSYKVDGLDRMPPEETVFAVADSADRTSIDAWQGRGFLAIGSAVDAVTGRELTAFARPGRAAAW